MHAYCARRMVCRGRHGPVLIMPAAPAAAETGTGTRKRAPPDPVSGMARPPDPDNHSATAAHPCGADRAPRGWEAGPVVAGHRHAPRGPARSGFASSSGGSGPGVPAGPDRRDLRGPHPGRGRLVPGQARIPRSTAARASPSCGTCATAPRPEGRPAERRSRRRTARRARSSCRPALGRHARRAAARRCGPLIGLLLLAFAVGFAVVALRQRSRATPEPRGTRAIGYVRVRPGQRRLDAHASTIEARCADHGIALAGAGHRRRDRRAGGRDRPGLAFAFEQLERGSGGLPRGGPGRPPDAIAGGADRAAGRDVRRRRSSCSTPVPCRRAAAAGHAAWPRSRRRARWLIRPTETRACGGARGEADHVRRRAASRTHADRELTLLTRATEAASDVSARQLECEADAAYRDFVALIEEHGLGR